MIPSVPHAVTIWPAWIGTTSIASQRQTNVRSEDKTNARDKCKIVFLPSVCADGNFEDEIVMMKCELRSITITAAGLAVSYFRAIRIQRVNTLRRPLQNGPHLQTTFSLSWLKIIMFFFFLTNSLKFISIAPINKKPVFLRLIACYRSGNKIVWTNHRVDSRFVPSQWETSLQSNAVSHWLCANLESALGYASTGLSVLRSLVSDALGSIPAARLNDWWPCTG